MFRYFILRISGSWVKYREEERGKKGVLIFGVYCWCFVYELFVKIQITLYILVVGYMGFSLKEIVFGWKEKNMVFCIGQIIE